MTGRHLLPFFLLSALIFLPYQLVALAIGGDPAQRAQASISWSLYALLFLNLLLATLVGAVIVHAVFQSLRSRPVSFFASIGAALRRLVPVLLLAVSMTLGFIVGFAFLVIPGLVLMTVWYVAMAACIVERCSPVVSLGRSLELTREHRWPVFGIIVLLFVVSMIGGFVILGLSGFLDTLMGTLATYAWRAFFAAVNAVVATVTYHDLRAEREGIDIEKIAEMFA